MSNSVRDRFRKIGVWERGDERAPHKPLLLLYAIGHLERKKRWISFRDVQTDVGELLDEFGPPRKSHHPEYPFWYLRTDGLWQVEDSETLPRRSNSKEPKVSAMKKRDTHGGFVDDVWDSLQDDASLRQDVVQMLLDAHFPTSMHTDILDAVGLTRAAESISSQTRRDPQFRVNVLRAYDFRCAVCGFDLKIDARPIGLEAAHIRWRQADGPDDVTNGLALCSLHHKMLDKGAIHVSVEMRLHVAESVHGSAPHIDRLRDRHGRRIHTPQRQKYTPRPDHVTWHVCEVFRGSYDASRPQ